MTTSASAIYNGLVTLIGNNLSTYTQLPDAYQLEENDQLRLEKGFSIGFFSGTNTNRTMGCPNIWIDRQFQVVFTNLYSANQTNVSQRGVREKALMEDAVSIWRILETTNVLNSVTVNCRYISDGGIEFIGEGQKYISILSTVGVEYTE